MDLVLISFTILLPITPAYILYKALPSRGTVRGPFKGLSIQLSGAFAGYFLLVLTLMGFLSTRHKAPDARYEVWEVSGQINWNQDGTPIDTDRMQMSFYPATKQKVFADGRFVIQVAPEVLESGQLKFPTLMIEHPDYIPVTIDLNASPARFGQRVKNVSIDNSTKEVAVKDTIELEKKLQLPAYQVTGASPQQTGLLSQGVKQ